MADVVVVLAHGKQARLGSLQHPKQLLTLGSETIIARTLRLASVVFPHARQVVVAPDTADWAWLHSANAEHVSMRVPGETLLEGMFTLSWPPQAKPGCLIFLLGDVVFSWATMREIADQRQLAFVGRKGPNRITGKSWGEMFALVVPDVLRSAVRNQIARELTNPQTTGRLWCLNKRWPENFVEVGPLDYTDDIDTVDDLVTVFPRLREAVSTDHIETLGGRDDHN